MTMPTFNLLSLPQELLLYIRKSVSDAALLIRSIGPSVVSRPA
jgi:hypothetical protein